MFTAAIKALNDITSPELRSVLWKSIALSIGLFVALLLAIEFALSTFTAFSWSWLTSGLQIITGLGMFAAFFFLMAPVTALFAGLFQDGIVAKLEQWHYPQHPAGKVLSYSTGILASVKFAAITLGLDLLVLPLVLFFGFGALLMLCANAYIISREYFELTAARYMPMREAVELRRTNALRIFIAGLIPGAVSLVPFVNFVTPVFATSYFLHLFKGRAS